MHDWNTPSKWDAYATALGQHVHTDPLAQQFQIGVVAAHFGEAMCLLIQLAFLYIVTNEDHNPEFQQNDEHQMTTYGRNSAGGAQQIVTRQPSKV